MITSIFNIFIFSITLIILCNFQCTLQFFLARIIRVFTLCSQAHWKQNSLKNSLIQASNIDEITNSNFDIFFSFDLGNVGFCIEWYLRGIKELFIRHWMLSHSYRLLLVLCPRSTLPKNSLERRWSSHTFRYGYLVTTSPQSPTLP